MLLLAVLYSQQRHHSEKTRSLPPVLGVRARPQLQQLRLTRVPVPGAKKDPKLLDGTKSSATKG